MTNHPLILKIFAAYCCLFFYNAAFAQNCGLAESELVIHLTTDIYAYETSWDITDVNGTIYGSVNPNTYANSTSYTDTVCIPENACVIFNLYDSYGDGIFEPGSYGLELNGEILFQQSTPFGYYFSYPVNCGAGQYCHVATEIEQDTFSTNFDDEWYVFIPDSIGTYEISTCFDSNACDTKIWIYEGCDNLTVSEDNSGTIFYNDNNEACNLMAVVEGYFDAGVPYFIRIGDAFSDCGGNPVTWSVNYLGPVSGCMDPSACNYNPLATIDDSSCIYFGEPGCPNGPDLVVIQSTLENSLYVSVENNDDPCYVAEGCMNGYGERTLVRFTTRIENNGDTDYFIGTPSSSNNQFTYDNCHGHFHYDGYAEYVLFDDQGVKLPIGFKNGFCVIDLDCSGGGSGQYSCGYMGISAGCADYYDASLPCQFIDVTDLEDGNYTFVTRVNWDNAPDVLGRYETDTLNNWAQVCINLDSSSGSLAVTLLEDCPTYVDCAGVLYGDAQPDCTGTCNGTALQGDLDNNGLQEMTDAENYVSLLAGDDLENTSCNDLSGEGNLTVLDAALLSSCVNFGSGHDHPDTGPHNHCNFQGIVNTTDLVTLQITGWNPDENYIDIGMRNPSASVVAYQFQMSGLQITGADNLVPPEMYPIFPATNNNTQTVYGISYQDSTILKSSAVQPLVRIYYTEITAEEVCIEAVQEIVNQDYEATTTGIEGNCLLISSAPALLKPLAVAVSPNPFDKTTTLQFNNPRQENFTLELSDVTGKIIRQYSAISNNSLTLQADDLNPGIYFYKLFSKSYLATGKISKK